MDSILNFLQWRAIGRGLRGYHTAWFVVGAAIWMLSRARNQSDVIFRTELKPGERLLVGRGSKASAPDGS